MVLPVALVVYVSAALVAAYWADNEWKLSQSVPRWLGLRSVNGPALGRLVVDDLDRQPFPRRDKDHVIRPVVQSNLCAAPAAMEWVHAVCALEDAPPRPKSSHYHAHCNIPALRFFSERHHNSSTAHPPPKSRPSPLETFLNILERTPVSRSRLPPARAPRMRRNAVIRGEMEAHMSNAMGTIPEGSTRAAHLQPEHLVHHAQAPQNAVAGPSRVQDTGLVRGPKTATGATLITGRPAENQARRQDKTEHAAWIPVPERIRRQRAAPGAGSGLGMHSHAASK